MGKCTLDHIKHQPTNEEFRCFKCGKEEAFFIEDLPDTDCDLIHTDDYFFCEICNEGWDGIEFEKALLEARERNRSTGWVSDVVFEKELLAVIKREGWDIPGVKSLLRKHYYDLVMENLENKGK